MVNDFIEVIGLTAPVLFSGVTVMNCICSNLNTMGNIKRELSGQSFEIVENLFFNVQRFRKKCFT